LTTVQVGEENDILGFQVSVDNMEFMAKGDSREDLTKIFPSRVLWKTTWTEPNKSITIITYHYNYKSRIGEHKKQQGLTH